MVGASAVGEGRSVMGGGSLAHVGEPWGCVKGIACGQSKNVESRKCGEQKKGRKSNPKGSRCHQKSPHM